MNSRFLLVNSNCWDHYIAISILCSNGNFWTVGSQPEQTVLNPMADGNFPHAEVLLLLSCINPMCCQSRLSLQLKRFMPWLGTVTNKSRCSSHQLFPSVKIKINVRLTDRLRFKCRSMFVSLIVSVSNVYLFTNGHSSQQKTSNLHDAVQYLTGFLSN